MLQQRELELLGFIRGALSGQAACSFNKSQCRRERPALESTTCRHQQQVERLRALGIAFEHVQRGQVMLGEHKPCPVTRHAAVRRGGARSWLQPLRQHLRDAAVAQAAL